MKNNRILILLLLVGGAYVAYNRLGSSSMRAAM